VLQKSEDTLAVEKVLAGDSEAFRPILDRYRKPVLSFIYNMTGNREHVEDLGQEVFLKAFHSLALFDAGRGAAFSTWLFAIARNACIDFRRKERRGEAVDRERTRRMAEPASDEGRDAVTQWLIEQALERLPEDQRLAVEWVFIQGMSYEAAARLEKVSVGTLSSRLARAKERLQKAIRGQEERGRHHGRET
jgi:RNA polymerase sigma-70 factor, ECF subfamily